jgi:hypothetical protein
VRSTRAARANVEIQKNGYVKNEILGKQHDAKVFERLRFVSFNVWGNGND